MSYFKESSSVADDFELEIQKIRKELDTITKDFDYEAVVFGQLKLLQKLRKNLEKLTRKKHA